jgi:hypothetical protein
MPVPSSYIGDTLSIKIEDSYTNENEVVESLVFRGRNLKPFAPYGVEFTRDGLDGATLSGYLRSRWPESFFENDNPVRQSDDLKIMVTFSDGLNTETTDEITVSDPTFSHSWTAAELDDLGVDSSLPLTGTVRQVGYLEGYEEPFEES